jgi:hypothetical protein
MSTIQNIHRQAMEFAKKGIAALEQGNTELYRQLTRQAFELEKKAALELISDYEAEPTRSVLFRSAATLAFNIEDYSEAKRLIYLGLSGNTYQEIKEELEKLLIQVSVLESAQKKTTRKRTAAYNDGELKTSIVSEPEAIYGEDRQAALPDFFFK